MKFDRKKFFDGYRKAFGKMTPLQVSGLSQVLDFIEKDRFITTIPRASYIFATTKHETADTFHPIHEYGGKAYFIKRYGGHTRKGKELGNDTPEEGYLYAGQGYPQTTGESNFEKAEDAIRKEYPEVVADFERRTGKHFDLTVGDQPNDEADPANMMDPMIAYVTMSIGMRKGMFTGHKFADHINEDKTDYKNARKIINGLDKATLIAGYATKFEKILRNSVGSASTPQVTPTEPDSGNSDTLNAHSTPPDISENGGTQIAGTIVNTGDTQPAIAPQTDPVTVVKESPSLFVKIGVLFTAITGAGINLGSIIQTKFEQMTPQQAGIMVAALGLVALGIYWYQRSAKGAQARTAQLVDKAADPASNTVELTDKK